MTDNPNDDRPREMTDAEIEHVRGLQSQYVPESPSEKSGGEKLWDHLVRAKPNPKREFMTAYVLARAGTIPETDFECRWEVTSASDAWDAILSATGGE